MSTSSFSRRNFLKRSLIVAGTLPVVAQVLQRKALAEDASLKPIDENSPLAATLGFHHDATKVDLVKFPKRKEAGGEKQFCRNCALGLQTGLKAEGQPGAWVKCSLFPQGVVNENGWCNSWVAKPS